MLKKILILTVVLLLLAYLAVAMTRLNRQPADAVCTDLAVTVDADGQEGDFITPADIKHLLQKDGLYPKGKKLVSIRCRDIEACLDKSPFIKEAECFKSPTGQVCVKISQRIPVFRIMADNGEQYYLDSYGTVIPRSGYAAHLPVVTGHVTQKNAASLLVELGRCLQNDPFWNSQVEQVNITPDGELEMVPRVGDHIVFLGKPRDIEGKLARLRTFYEKALNKVGWNKYARISLEFNNQIICTKNR